MKDLFKKFTAALLLFAAVLTFSGCPPDPGSISHTTAPYTAPKEENVTHDVFEKRFSYTVDERWTVERENGTEYYSYYDSGARIAARLNGVSPDNFLDPQTNLDKLIEKYDAEIYIELEDGKDKNNVGYKYACIKPSGYENMFMFLIFCEPRNMIVSYTMEYRRYNNDDRLPDGYLETVERTFYYSLRDMALSTVFVPAKDILRGTVIKKDGEPSLTAELRDDGSFSIYESAEKYDSEHINGSYKVYVGRAAIEKIASMTEYGLTEEEQKNVIVSRGAYCDRYFAIVYDINEIVKKGELTAHEGTTVLYVGTADEDGSCFELTNCNSFTNEIWRLSE